MIPKSNKIERLKKIIDRNQREIDQKLNSSMDAHTLRGITNDAVNEQKVMLKAKTPFSFRKSDSDHTRIRGNVEIINNELQRIKTITTTKMQSSEGSKLHDSYDPKFLNNEIDSMFNAKHILSIDKKNEK